MALPHTVTGTCSAPPTWLPVALPLMVTGTCATAPTWLPVARPPLLAVVTLAFAALPATSRNPADRTPTFRDLRTHVFMVKEEPFGNFCLLSNLPWACFWD